MIVFKKEYDDESIYDVGRDVAEAFDEDFNPVMCDIPKDEYSFSKGIFTITIEWCNSE
jgi:hypothetical protein